MILEINEAEIEKVNLIQINKLVSICVDSAEYLFEKRENGIAANRRYN